VELGFYAQLGGQVLEGVAGKNLHNGHAQRIMVRNSTRRKSAQSHPVENLNNEERAESGRTSFDDLAEQTSPPPLPPPPPPVDRKEQSEQVLAYAPRKYVVCHFRNWDRKEIARFEKMVQEVQPLSSGLGRFVPVQAVFVPGDRSPNNVTVERMNSRRGGSSNEQL